MLSIRVERRKRVSGLCLDFVKFGDRLVQRHSLVLELQNAAPYRAQKQAQLLGMRGIGIVQIKVFLDFPQRKPQLFAAQYQNHARSIALGVDPVVAGTLWGDETLIFVEPNGSRGDPQVKSQFGDRVQLSGRFHHFLLTARQSITYTSTT